MKSFALVAMVVLALCTLPAGAQQFLLPEPRLTFDTLEVQDARVDILAITPNGTYWGLVEGGQISRSSNRGATWQASKLVPGGNTHLIPVSNDTLVYWAQGALITTNGGTTWEGMPGPGIIADSRYYSDMYAHATRGIFSIIRDEMPGPPIKAYRLSDDRTEWISLCDSPGAPQYCSMVFPDSSGRVYVMSRDSLRSDSLYLYSTPDSGRTWMKHTDIPAGILPLLATGIRQSIVSWTVTPEGFLIALASDGTILCKHTADSVVRYIGRSPDGSKGLHFTSFATDSQGYLVCASSEYKHTTIIRSRESLNILTAIPLPPQTDVEFDSVISSVALSNRQFTISSNGDIWSAAISGRQGLVRSSDGGRTWVWAGQSPEAAWGNVLVSGDTVTLLYDWIARTTDGGAFWTAAQSGRVWNTTDHSWSSFSISAQDMRVSALGPDGTVWAVWENEMPGGSRIIMHYDSPEDTWQGYVIDSAVYESMQINQLFADIVGRVYVRMDSTLRSTSDSGRTWLPVAVLPARRFLMDATGRRLYGIGNDSIHVYDVTHDGISHIASWQPVSHMNTASVLWQYRMYAFDDRCAIVRDSCVGVMGADQPLLRWFKHDSLGMPLLGSTAMAFDPQGHLLILSTIDTITTIYRSRKPLGGIVSHVQELAGSTVAPIHVYPNPSGSLLQVDGDDVCSLTLYGMDGRSVQRTVGMASMDVSAIPPGTYVLQIIAAPGAYTQLVTVVR